MIKTVKQTLESLRDLNYGPKIIKQSFGQVIWYWFKYILLIGICVLGLGVFALVYFTPQIPKFLEEKLPDVGVTLENGKVTSTVAQPFVWGDKNMALIINTKGSLSDLKDYENGVLLLSDQVLFKNSSETKVISLADIKEKETLDKKEIVDWTKNNQPWILAVGLLTLGVLIIVGGGLFLIWQAGQFALWGVFFWVISLTLHKNLSYKNAVKFFVTASVITLWLSTLNILFQDRVLSLVGIALSVVYTGIWIYHLPRVEKK